MPAVCRVSDLISHGGTVIAGSSTMALDGLAVARVGDPATCATHGAVVILTGSPSMVLDGQAVARVGDTLSCGAALITGSPTMTLD